MITFIVCLLAGLGAGLGTGFAGMSAAAVISPMLITRITADTEKIERKIRFVTFHSPLLVALMYSCDGIYHPLGDIYRMVADPLIILRDHEQIEHLLALAVGGDLHAVDGHGALRVSARRVHEEVQNVEKQIRKLVQGEA